MNLTLSIDEKVADEARRAAQRMGMSLNQAVRLYLERLAGREQLEAELAAFKASARRSTGRRKGWTFDRNELHERS
jgi:antitoxin component of RelBE/YafQ-DinJ toxin-antitoxin module